MMAVRRVDFITTEKKDGKETAPGFAEKLLTQIIRNMQVLSASHLLFCYQ